MKIVLIDGCGYSLEVDGKEFIDLTAEEQIKVCEKILNSKLCTESTRQSFVEQFVEVTGDVEDLGYCEQCGSTNDKYNIELK